MLSTAVSARAEQPDAYSAAAPPHFYFGYYAPPQPGATDRGFGGQYLREDNYEQPHGLDVAQAECTDPYSCPCPSPYFRNSTNSAPVVIPPRPPAPEPNPCTIGICEMDPSTNNTKPD
jgi:hypothetical protein